MARVTRLDGREQRFALWAAGFGAVSAVAFYAPAFDEFTAAIVLALIGVAMAGLLALASRSGNRLFTCIAAGLLGVGPWGYAYIIGLPFLVLAGWLLYRDANARRAAKGSWSRERPPREKQADVGPAKEESATEKPVRKKKAPIEPRSRAARPGPSKRYTPPAGRR